MSHIYNLKNLGIREFLRPSINTCRVLITTHSFKQLIYENFDLTGVLLKFLIYSYIE